jgi:hypothetical protein
VLFSVNETIALSRRLCLPRALAGHLLEARAPSVLPWMRVTFLRDRAPVFFFCFSTLRAERAAAAMAVSSA